MNPATRLGPLGQIARSVKDIEQSESWYRDTPSGCNICTREAVTRLGQSQGSIVVERTPKAGAP
jgi:hypothetical protein